MNTATAHPNAPGDAVRIVRVDPHNPGHRRAFIQLPFRLYRPTPLWAPPLQRDVAALLDPRSRVRGPAAEFWLAVRPGGRVAGRLGALDPGRVHGSPPGGGRTAFFNWLECEDDDAVAGALLGEAAAWARARGLDRLEGPRWNGLLDSLGLLVDGFEYAPAYGIPYHHRYYSRLIEAFGFEPSVTWSSGYLDPASYRGPRLTALAARARRGGYDVTSLTRRGYWRWVPVLRDIYNRSIGDQPDWPPLSDADARQLASQLTWLADPGMVKILLHRGAPAGFVVAYPDVTAGVRAAKGRLTPGGTVQIVRSRLTTRVLDVIGLAVVPEHRRTGALALLMSELAEAVLASRYGFVEIVHVAEDNAPMRAALDRVGVRWTKAHRTYAKRIDAAVRHVAGPMS